MKYSDKTSVPNWLVFDKFDYSFKLANADGMPHNSFDSECAELKEIAYTDKNDNCYFSYGGKNFFIVYNPSAKNPCLEESSSGTILPLRNSSGEYFRSDSDEILCAYKNLGLFFVPVKEEVGSRLILSANEDEFSPISSEPLKNHHRKSFENAVAQNTKRFCDRNPDSEISDRSLLNQALRHPLCRNRAVFRKKTWLTKKSVFDYSFAPGEFHPFGNLIYSEIEGSDNEVLVPVVYVNREGRERASFAGKQLHLKRSLDEKCREFSNFEKDAEHEIIRFLDENGNFLTNPEDGKILCAYKDECLFLIPLADNSELDFNSSTWDYVPFLHTKALDAVEKYMPQATAQSASAAYDGIPSRYIKFSDFWHTKSNVSGRARKIPFVNTMYSCTMNFRQ